MLWDTGRQTARAESITASLEGAAAAKDRPPCRNYAWAHLMMRVFRLDVLECEKCGSRLHIMAAIHPPDTPQKILDCLGLSPRAPPLKPAVSEPFPESF